MAGLLTRAAVVLLVCCALPAQAARDNDATVVTSVDTTLGARFNPLGVAAAMRLNLRWHPVRRSDALRSTSLGEQLFNQTSLGVAASVDANPAFVRAGVAVEFTPVSVWRLRLNWQALQSFGQFNQFLEFNSVGDNYDNFAKRRMREEHPLRPRLTHRLLADSNFQIRVWRIVVLDQTTLEYAPLGNGVYYNGEYDLLVKGQDVVVRNVLLGGVVILDKPGLPESAVGGFHMWTRAMNSRVQNQQVGLAVVFAPIVGRRQPRNFTMISLIGFHLEHQHRQHTPFLAWLTSWTFL